MIEKRAQSVKERASGASRVPRFTLAARGAPS
jgi:hypothetical protein